MSDFERGDIALYLISLSLPLFWLLYGFLFSGGQKLRIYSAHDSSLIALLMVLGVWDNEWPEFSSSLCVEVYKDKQVS